MVYAPPLRYPTGRPAVIRSAFGRERVGGGFGRVSAVYRRNTKMRDPTVLDGEQGHPPHRPPGDRLDEPLYKTAVGNTDKRATMPPPRPRRRRGRRTRP